MRGLLADNNCDGHLRAIEAAFRSEQWRSVWESLNLDVRTMASENLAPGTPDRLVWQYCQDHELVLITRNRRAGGADSLEQTIRTLNRPHSFPVVTLVKADLVFRNRDYMERIAERILDYLLDMENFRGTGRLWAP